MTYRRKECFSYHEQQINSSLGLLCIWTDGTSSLCDLTEINSPAEIYGQCTFGTNATDRAVKLRLGCNTSEFNAKYLAKNQTCGRAYLSTGRCLPQMKTVAAACCCHTTALYTTTECYRTFLTIVTLARIRYELPDDGHRPKYVGALVWILT